MRPFQDIDFEALAADELADYIIQKHHHYEKQMLPVIMSRLHALGSSTNDSPELILVYNELTKLTACLAQHMKNEEQILFPFINTLLAAKQNSSLGIRSVIALTESPLRLLVAEHEVFTNIMNKIRKATNGYNPQPGCDTEKKYCYAQLAEFDADIHTHIYLENNVLFPKLIALEQSTMVQLQTDHQEVPITT